MHSLTRYLVIFDFDGTLADSFSGIYRAKQIVARQLQLEMPSQETVRKAIGFEFLTALQICFPCAAISTLEEFIKRFRLLMQEDAYQPELFVGTRDMLNALQSISRRYGVKTEFAIASSKSHAELQKAIEFNQLRPFFPIDQTFCGDQFVGGKTHPNMLETLLNTFKLELDSCLMVGDTEADVRFGALLRPHIQTVCVSWGMRTRAELLAADLPPFQWIEHWDEFVKIFEHFVRSQLH